MSKSESSQDIRINTANKLSEIFKSHCSKQEQLNRLVRIIEQNLHQYTIKQLVQNSDISWNLIYNSFYSNLIYNLEQYEHHEEVIKKIIENPQSELVRIIINGPLAVNEHLTEIKDLRQTTGTEVRVKYSSNTGGQVYCPKCRQNDVYRQLVQLRGSDEAFSSCYSCLNVDCGYQWTR